MELVNRKSPTPLYEQLKLVVRDQILSGAFPLGTQLPTEQAFCEMYQISRITVTRALHDLEREGLIKRIQGKGSIVTLLDRAANKQDMRRIKGLTKVVKESGGTITSKILAIDTFTASPTIANIFCLPADQNHRMMRIRRLRYVNDKPAVVMTTIVRETFGLRMQEHNLSNCSFYELYEKITGLPVIRNETELTPILASPEIIDLLKVKSGSPHFLFHGISFLEGDLPIEICVAIYHGEMFSFSTNIYRLQPSNGFSLTSEATKFAMDKGLQEEVIKNKVLQKVV